MPRGTRHTLTGTLRWNGRCHSLELEDGGYWLLDTTRRYRRLIDCKVTVDGARSGFNLLDVSNLVAAGSASTLRGVRPFWRRLLRIENGRLWTKRLD